ncbi:MAG TPA: 50S ribosomal protein L17 [Candidatus Paceibacterota bacterium]|nr:50S ribosomal protein L17 [Candidatus Paceibacterota bacterium]
MRHRKKKQKLGSSFHQRKAILRSLASALVLKEKIFTTEGKAKKMRPFLEKAITRARKNTIADRRILLKTFPVRIVDKLMKEIGPRYINQAGGYIRIIKTASRKADAAKMVLIELVKK